ncbi:MAG: 3'-5' exonuclease [Synechococcaceae cyanobacterium]|nr:3'-5' exonuclease [Synechococcaceae cyanobacterium]
MPDSTAHWDQGDLLSLSPPGAEASQPSPSREPALAAAPEPVLAVLPSPRLELADSDDEAGSDAVAIPETLLILDTETTGLSPAEHRCIEVGAVLFHVAGRSVLTQVSFLLPCQSNSAAHVNGIDAALSRLPQPWPQALACFEAMVAACDAVLAHNAAFDRQWFGRPPLPAIPRRWICSMEDLAWPVERHLRATPSVRDLALAYGVPVWAAHRALTDCIYLAQVLERCDDLEALLAAALEPRQLYRAEVSYAERQLAREAGFRWNDPVPRAWTRRLSCREAEALPFAVKPVACEESAASAGESGSLARTA